MIYYKIFPFKNFDIQKNAAEIFSTVFKRRSRKCKNIRAIPYCNSLLNPPAFYMERYLRMDLPQPVIGDWAVPPPNGGVGDGPAADRVDLKGEALRAARAGYYGLINHVDDQIRRLLNPVDGVDVWTRNNTVVLFTSDHGEMLGDHYLWRKAQPYEVSARIPLLIRAPERFGLKRGTRVDAAVALEDIMPTVLEMAGIPVPPSVEGRSLLPLMQGKSGAWRDHLHIEHAPLHHTLTDGREKFIWFAADGREQFFRLSDDPQERRNLIAVPGEQPRIADWRARLVAELMERPEGFSDGQKLIPGRPYPPVLVHNE